MGYGLLVGIVLAVALPLVLLGFMIYWLFTHAQRSSRENSLDGYARSRALDYAPATGEWPNRTNPAVTWISGEATFRLSPIGREGRCSMRLVVRPTRTLLGALRARVDGSGVVVDAERPRGLADRLLTTSVRRALLAFRQRDVVLFAYTRGKVVLEWPDADADFARLDEARAVATVATEVVDAAFERPVRAA